MHAAIDLSIIVVSYNTRALLQACLQSLSSTLYRLQLIVVDNASQDESAAMIRSEFPDVLLIDNNRNKGFGAACNQGLQASEGRYALILNADIEATENGIDGLIEFMDTHPEATGCGGKLFNPDGTLQPSCAADLSLWAVFCEQTLLSKAFPRTRLFGGYWRTWWDFSETIEVEQIMGACLLMRRDAAGEFVRFDEDYFLYCEDTDLCYRLRRAGGKLFYVHDALFRHHLGASGTSARAEMIIHYNRGKERFFRKFHGRGAAFICRLLNGFGAFWRWLLWSMLSILTLFRVSRFRQQARLFWHVLRGTSSLPNTS
jgi:GT2 family glycosyltransferase